MKRLCDVWSAVIHYYSEWLFTYASEDPQQLVRRQEPKAKTVYIDGKKWLDITEIVGNSEEIIALHTVPEKKRKSKNKPLPRNASGALSRADR